MYLGTLAMLATEAESDLAESESVVAWAPWVYGAVALVVLLSLLLVVTRLDLDR